MLEFLTMSNRQESPHFMDHWQYWSAELLWNIFIYHGGIAPLHSIVFCCHNSRAAWVPSLVNIYFFLPYSPPSDNISKCYDILLCKQWNPFKMSNANNQKIFLLGFFQLIIFKFSNDLFHFHLKSACMIYKVLLCIFQLHHFVKLKNNHLSPMAFWHLTNNNVLKPVSAKGLWKVTF